MKKNNYRICMISINGQISSLRSNYNIIMILEDVIKHKVYIYNLVFTNEIQMWLITDFE